MAGSLVLFTVILPLLLGCVLAGIAFFTPARVALLTLATLAAILFIYYFLEGLPPLPPVSSKHKIFYIFIALGVAASASQKINRTPQVLLTIGLLLAALFWIGQRKISADPFQLEIFLGLLPVIGAGILSATPQENRAQVFLWPSAFMTLAISGSLVSILGGYIGLAQMLGSFAALFGGFLAVSYVAIYFLGRSATLANIAGLNWLLMVAASTILLSIAIFANKLSAVAFVLVCSVYLTPFITARFVGSKNWWTPFLMGGVSLVPALCAIAFAWAYSL